MIHMDNAYIYMYFYCIIDTKLLTLADILKETKHAEKIYYYT